MKAACCASDPRARAPIPVRPATARGSKPRSPTRTWCSAASLPISFWAARCISRRRALLPQWIAWRARSRRNRVTVAQGIVRVANANMERAIRVVSVERGHDPRDFPLVAFGGCGGLHACEMAEELGIRTVIVPRFAGALSALGMLLADRVRDYSAGVLDPSQIEKRFAQLERTARRDMPGAKLERMADVRYVGQSYELTIPWGASFHDEHQRIYGYCDPARPDGDRDGKGAGHHPGREA